MHPTAILSDRVPVPLKTPGAARALFFHDSGRIWCDLTQRFASCATRDDLKRVIPAAFREFFGLRSAVLYLADRNSGSFVSAAAGVVPRRFSASAGLSASFAGGAVWSPGGDDYLPDREEGDFARETKARLVIPLVCSTFCEGLIAIGPRASEEAFSDEDRELMKTTARHSASLLAAFRLEDEVAELRELGVMDNFFAAHDLKNLTQTLVLVIENAEQHGGNPEFRQDSIAAVRETVAKMKTLIRKLKYIPSDAPSGCTDIRTVAESVIHDFLRAAPHAALRIEGERVLCAMDAEELRNILVNLVQNGLDASGRTGTVLVRTGRRNDGSAFVRVSDSGEGMTEEFMERDLFRAFRSTKRDGLGIGLYQCRQIVERRGGTIEASSGPGQGSSFTVTLPQRTEARATFRGGANGAVTRREVLRPGRRVKQGCRKRKKECSNGKAADR